MIIKKPSPPSKAVRDENGAKLVKIMERDPVNTAAALKLIAAGASLDIGNDIGDTALILAVCENHTDIVAALIKAGAPLNQYNSNRYTPVLTAVLWEAPESLALLLAAGADPRGKDSKGFTALEYANDIEDKFYYDMINKALEKYKPQPIIKPDYRAAFEQGLPTKKPLKPSRIKKIKPPGS